MSIDFNHSGRNWGILVGDVLDRLSDLPDRSVQCVATSPPYWGLRDYQHEGQIGLEASPVEFISRMVEVFDEVGRVLRDDGTLWLNLGDTYVSKPKGSMNGQDKSGLTSTRTQEHSPSGINKRVRSGHAGKHAYVADYPVDGPNRNKSANRRDGADVSPLSHAHKGVESLKEKNLVGIPWRVALALQDAGWYLRQDIIWAKKSPMPESVRDRCSKAHEYIFLLTKSPNYFYDSVAVREAATGGVKANASFIASVYNATRDDLPTDRNKRGVWSADYGIDDAEALWEFLNADVGGGDLWTFSTEPFGEAHFATFPSAVPRTCIKAGTSAVGACPTCGAPWERIVERNREATRPGTNSKVNRASNDEASPYEQQNGSIVGNRDPNRHQTTFRTIGWQPTCDHEHTRDELVPCVVLDPFVGSGTTVRAAIDLGRIGWGIELNPEYAELAERRILRPAKSKTPPKPTPGKSHSSKMRCRRE
ncbi:DNA-methyltransferase [Stratiformator vulcanicus]|uniref:Methyltransferase n=1 Tax=Stratiformator vulcanicus TaxID=2527980 RepID=A0A517R785_9PLAN|nr:site-specific DNA-methyltransferase [Stratiformator vulcanicus]QDT39748.1 putative methyltransferase [Stratiformator vulcanicus]